MSAGYTPIYRIYKDGADITNNFNDRTLTIEVELANLGIGDICKITVDDRDWLVAFPEVGDHLDVWLGYEEVGLSYMGKFEISSVTFMGPPKSISIEGSSVETSSVLKIPQLQSFENKSVGDILKQLGSAAGLQVDVHSSLSSIQVPFRNQTTSAMHLINEFERMFGGVAKVANGKLVFAPRDEGVSAGGLSIPILRLGPEHFGQWQVTHSTRSEHSEVQASYFDQEENVRKWVSQGRLGNVFPKIEEGSLPYQIGQLFGSKAEAEAAAKARMSALIRSSGRFTGMLAAGDPWIRDQQRLQIAGMRDGIDGSYIIEVASHSYSDQGLTTQLEAANNGTGENYADQKDLSQFLIPLPGETMGKLIVGTNGMIAGGV